MKIDMHCHVKEGSPDSKIGLDEYITILKANGFGGMVVTDHDTYNGYRHWKNKMKGNVHQDFVVLKGIEYDTCDAGHILVIMPQGVRMRLLELKGMPVSVLIDFVEVFNACEPLEVNEMAAKLAYKYGKPGVGGSDAHNATSCGMAYTELPEPITCETELIELIRKKVEFGVGGMIYNKTLKDRLGKIKKIYSYSFWIYNKTGELIKRRARCRKSMLENPMDAIDPIEIEYLASYRVRA